MYLYSIYPYKRPIGHNAYMNHIILTDMFSNNLTIMVPTSTVCPLNVPWEQ